MALGSCCCWRVLCSWRCTCGLLGLTASGSWRSFLCGLWRRGPLRLWRWVPPFAGMVTSGTLPWMGFRGGFCCRCGRTRWTASLPSLRLYWLWFVLPCRMAGRWNRSTWWTTGARRPWTPNCCSSLAIPLPHSSRPGRRRKRTPAKAVKAPSASNIQAMGLLVVHADWSPAESKRRGRSAPTES